jgi:hypothetical protein
LSCFASVFSIYRDHPASDHILASVRLAATLNRNTSRLKAIWHLVSLSSQSWNRTAISIAVRMS